MAESSGVRVDERVLVSCREGKTKEVTWEKGTVRYVGPVRDQAGEWLGIEWDNPNRGKHDGQFEGHRYFSCRTQKWNPCPASFVREKRIQRGASLVDAVREKYCGGVSQDLECEMFIHTSSNLRLPVTLVGQDSIVKQQSVLDELKAVYLNGSKFSFMGPKGEIQQTIPKVTDLDLSDTLLGSWEEVTKLSEELPHLQLLDISRNEITWAKPLHLPSGPLFEHLRSLVLNNCFVDWQTVMSIAAKIPTLSELHVAGNGIKTLVCENISSCLGNLQVLHLEDNFIPDWAEVKRLSVLPSLKKLNLSGNLLAEIETYSEENKPGFALLTTLFLQNNSLKEWKDIDTLNHFESLTEVRASGMPLFDGLDMITARQGVTARLPRLRRLNGSTVTQKERVDAEIDYLSSVLTESVGKEIKDIAAKHPRFPALLKSYGNINLNTSQSSKASNDRTTISKTLLSLELSLVAELQAEESIKSVKKKLPSNLTLSKFKILCQRLLGVSANSQVVYIKREEPENTYEELIHEEDTLQQLGVCDGNCIRILEG